jgi:hypothetical protein
VSTRQFVPPAVDNLVQHHTEAEEYKGPVGEVWWLLDSGRPCLAEVFKRGVVQDTRLPHFNKSTIRGSHVARICEGWSIERSKWGLNPLEARQLRRFPFPLLLPPSILGDIYIFKPCTLAWRQA